MKRMSFLAGLLIAMALPLFCLPAAEVRITIIYDNYQADERLGTDWGFACLVEYDGKKMLFDAGNNAALYRENMVILGIDPAEVPSLFISHHHGDHTAGIPWIVETNPDIRCYLPASWAASLESAGELPPHSKGMKDPSRLYGPFYSTGDNFVDFREHGLVIKMKEGAVLVTGCGHPGVVEMVKAAEELTGTKVRAVIGGLHLMRNTDISLEEIASSLKKLGVGQICPTHCTGDHSIAFLKESFGDGYIPGGTGQVITIK